MKNFIYALLLSIICLFDGFSQNVQILPSGITPAMSGVYPRLQYSAIIALPNPQEGDIAYDLTYKCLRVYNGQKWINTQNQCDVTPNLSYLTSINGNGHETVRGLAVDDSSNIYVTGGFSSKVYFGANQITPTSPTLILDMYLAKYDKDGNFKWLQVATGTSTKFGTDITLDNLGNIYIIGNFFGTATFGSTVLTSAGDSDIFIAKYDKNGVLQWVKSAGGTTTDNSYSITIDTNANVFITGNFQGVATFETSSITSSGSSDVFFAKYDNNGTLQWVKRAGGTGSDLSAEIEIDYQNNIVMMGYFSNTATFETTNLVSSGSTDVFLAKYDSNGTLVWVKKAGGTGYDDGADIALDSNGNIYITGRYNGSAVFESQTLNSLGSSDIFLAKYLNNGALAWIQTAGGISDDRPSSLLIDQSGNIYLSAELFSKQYFFNSRYYAVSQSGNKDLVIAKYLNDGLSVDWVKQGAVASTTSFGINYTWKNVRMVKTNSNNMYLSYNFDGSLTIDGKNYFAITPTNTGFTDSFIFKIIP